MHYLNLYRLQLDWMNLQETRDLTETLDSFKNTKAVLERIEGSGVVQNQSESEGWTESHSQNTDTNPSSSTESQFTEAENPRMDTSQTDAKILETSNPKVFSFAELKAATKNFSSDVILGEGSFGPVFKGWLDEKTEIGTEIMVAIKKYNPYAIQSSPDFKFEMKFLGSFSHPNIVKLLGYCLEEKQILVVHEFMAGGSLEIHLFQKIAGIESLTWRSRLKIAIGAARGLAFLHTSAKQAMFDYFKTSNILLDRNFNAKISGFGLQLLGPIGGLSRISNRGIGTYGHVAPEYIATGHLYMKSDVYGFGVVLLELLTGLRAVDSHRPMGQHNLVEWAKPLLLHERKLMGIMDVRMEGQYSTKAASQAAQITQKCLAPDPKSRPSMKEVLMALEAVQIIEIEEKNVGKV